MSGLLLLQRRHGLNGTGSGGPFFIDVHVTDAEAVMEDADTKVEIPVDLLPTPRIDDELVTEKDLDSGGGGGGGEEEESFDVQFDAKDLVFGGKGRAAASGGGGGGRGKGGDAAAAAAALSDEQRSPGATIRDLERKGDGKNKSFKFTVDLDFIGTKSKTLTLKRQV